MQTLPGLFLVPMLALALSVSTTKAEPVDAPASMIMLRSGIVCESVEAAEAAFQWASDNPHAVNLEDQPDCTMITVPVMAVVQPLHIFTTEVARVVIASATPGNGDTRYIWLRVQMLPTSVEQDA